MAENLRAERVGECWEGFGAGRWRECLLVGGFSVGFRLVVKAFQLVFDRWVGFSVGFRLVGSGVPVCRRSWWRGSGAGLVDRWLVYRMCIRDGLLRIALRIEEWVRCGSHVGTGSISGQSRGQTWCW